MRMAQPGELTAKLHKALRPWSAGLEVTRRCNLRCIQCLRGDAHPDDGLSYDQIRQVLDQLADLGCMRLSLTGGEPFARPDILPVLEYAWRRRVAVEILTNATLVTSRLADRLVDLHIHELQVSLYGATAPMHEAVTRTPGSFSATLQGLQRLVDRRLRVRVMMPVLAVNVQHVHAVRELCAEWGVRFRRSLLLFPGDDGSPAPLDYLATDEQLTRLAVQERQMGVLPADQSALNVIGTERPLCTAGRQQIGIGFDGTVYPCGALHLPAGNLLDLDLGQIWRTSPVLEMVRAAHPVFPGVCDGCPARPGCFWCPGLSLALEADPGIPNTQDCRRTRIFFGGMACEPIQ